MESRFRGAQPPPRGKRIDVHRVKTVEAQEFVFLSPSYWGIWHHWHGTRSSECRAEKGNCHGCENNWPRYFKGFVAALTNLGRTKLILELTTTACEMINEKLPARKDMRGAIVRISKTKGGPKGRYLIDVLERRLDPADLPEDFDPMPELRRLWAAKKNPGHSAA